MKCLFCTVALFVMCNALAAEDGFEPLFNGADLDGWQSLQELKSAGTGQFTVNQTEQSIHVYAGRAGDSEQEADLLFTRKEYSHFILKLEYKWLEKRFAPRATHDRDAGLLFHMHGDLTLIWPKCLEMQLGESESTKKKDRYTTGDLWVIGKDVQAMNERVGAFYSPGAQPVPVGKNKEYDKSFTPSHNEKPHGEWNEITLTVRGAEESIFELNGKVMNRAGKFLCTANGEVVPLEKGRIGLQAEYAELMYRHIRIKELPPDGRPVGQNP